MIQTQVNTCTSYQTRLRTIQHWLSRLRNSKPLLMPCLPAAVKGTCELELYMAGIVTSLTDDSAGLWEMSKVQEEV